ncbi:MAG: DUF4129 domain-containing protein [Nocardioides sp.]
MIEPPLGPSPDEARRLLQRELVHPEYHEQSLLEELFDWVDRFVSGSIEAASDVPPLSTLAAMVAFLALALALTWLASRARRSGRVARDRAVVATDEVLTAAELRRRADLALAEGRNGDAVVDGFRALAVRQVERGRLDDLPGATAHEVATAVGAAHPDARAHVDRTAALFDAVRYGDRPATAEQAVDVLELDDALGSRT